MSGGIYLVRDDDSLVEMTEAKYDSEDVLQELLAKYPNLLAGDQIDPERPRRWLLIAREMGLPSEDSAGNRWAVDHPFVDQEGIPTLVEVKRSSDTRLRREVVGQLLEYAANAVVYWPLNRIIEAFEGECDRNAVEPYQGLVALIGEDADAAAFWTAVHTNLQAGRVRLVFVADLIPRELRRIVEFLNEQMDPADVFAIEVKQFAGGKSRALVPRLIGATERKRSAAAAQQKRQWTEETFFENLAIHNSDDVVSTVRKLLNELRAIDGVEIWWGQGTTTASFVPSVKHAGHEFGLFRVLARGGRIETYFGTLRNRGPFESEAMRAELRAKYNAIDGIDIPGDGIDRYPSIPLRALAADDALAEFISIHRWVIEEIRGS